MAADALLVGAGHTAGSTVTTAAGSCTTGDTLVACVSFDPGTTISSISDTAGNTYTPAKVAITANAKLSVYLCDNATGNASNVLTVNFSGSAFAVAHLLRATSVANPSYDSGSLATDTTTHVSPNSVTSATFAQANNIVLCLGEWNGNGGTNAYTSADTIVSQDSDAVNFWTSFVLKRYVTATTAITMQAVKTTETSSGVRGMVIFGLKEGSVAAATTQHVENANRPRPGRGPFSKGAFQIKDHPGAITANTAISGTASITLGALTSSGAGSVTSPVSALDGGNRPRPGRGPFSLGKFYMPEYPAYTPSAINGTASITLGALTAAGTGALAISATGAATLGALTVSGTGALALSGSASITLAALTVSGAGALAISGTGAATLDDVTLSGAGAGISPGTGTAAITLDALTVSASGALALSASGAMTLADLTAAGTGSIAISGAGAATLAALTLTATGQVLITGIGSATLGALTVAAAGAGGGFGSADITLDALTASGTATITGVPASENSGGYAYLTAYDRYIIAKRKRQQEEDEREEQIADIKSDLDQQIAKLLYAQEAKDAELKDLQRLKAIAARTPSFDNQRVAKARAKALENPTLAAFESLRREIERMQDEEDFAVLLMLAND